MNNKKMISLLYCIIISAQAQVFEKVAVPAHALSISTEKNHANIFTSGPDVTVDTLRTRFKDKKIAFYVDLHDVFARRSHAIGLARFKENSVPTAFKKVEFTILTAGILVPTLCNSVRLYFSKHNPDGTRTEKGKITENHFLFIKNWWSTKLYKYLIQYSTDMYYPNEDMITLLYKLKEAGHRVYLFSNGGYDTIKALEQDDRFKEYFEGPNRLFSDTPKEGQNSNSINDRKQKEYHLAKPAPDAFEAALAKHNESADYVVFFDNDEDKLADYQNKKIRKRYPHFKNFWACSILYNDTKHSETEDSLQALGIL